VACRVKTGLLCDELRLRWHSVADVARRLALLKLIAVLQHYCSFRAAVPLVLCIHAFRALAAPAVVAAVAAVVAVIVAAAACSHHAR
jgi:hypothetical protein